MCLAAIAIGEHSRFPFVLMSNRDEYFSRPALAMHWWEPQPGGPSILAGRDLSAGGTWLGLNESGHLGLLTNVREPGRSLAVSPSRGELVTNWLSGERADPLALGAVRRNGFNLLTADLSGDPTSSEALPMAWCLSNRPRLHRVAVGPGVIGLSNAALDTPWPKVNGLKRRMSQALLEAGDLRSLVAKCFAALADRSLAPADQLPATGLTPDRELRLSSAFVRIAGECSEQDYGTRCSTVVVVEQSGHERVVHIAERTFDRDAAASGEVRFARALPLGPASDSKRRA